GSTCAWLLLAAVLTEFAVAETPVPESVSSHWAFQPVRAVSPPKIRHTEWAKNPIDQFLLADMERHELQPAAPATPAQLLRRVSYDLTGLPPAPEELESFLHGTTPDRYERLVERLLSSPAYGERWARHWLDLARYAESDGFEHDAVRPNTWRYRD